MKANSKLLIMYKKFVFSFEEWNTWQNVLWTAKRVELWETSYLVCYWGALYKVQGKIWVERMMKSRGPVGIKRAGKGKGGIAGERGCGKLLVWAMAGAPCPRFEQGKQGLARWLGYQFWESFFSKSCLGGSCLRWVWKISISISEEYFYITPDYSIKLQVPLLKYSRRFCGNNEVSFQVFELFSKLFLSLKYLF